MRFMDGRNGNDDLNRFISIFVIIFAILGFITPIRIFLYIGLGLLVIQLFRSFSRNLDKREEENDRFLDFKDNLLKKRENAKNRKNDTAHAYFKCPKCRKQLRVPSGKGKIQIHCPQCGTDFIKKT